MTNEEIQIVIIDDDLSKTHPVIIYLEKDYPNVELIRTTTAGVNYIKNNLNKNLILILDYYFKNDVNGDVALNNIRKMSKFIPVILFTAEYPREKFKNFIDLKTLAFARKSDYEDVGLKVEEAKLKMQPFIQKAQDEWNNNIIGLLEDWVEIRDNDRRKRDYKIPIGNQNYELEELLSKIQTNPKFGDQFEKRLNQTTIKQLVKEGIELETILVIDDRLEETDPIIIQLKLNVCSNVILKNTPQKGVNYVKENLDKIMVIILDYKFSSSDPNGSWAIQRIRQYSKVIPIILMSVQGNMIGDYDEFINNNTFAFAHQRDYEDVEKKVIEAREYWQRITEGAYEEWVNSKDQTTRNQPFLAMAGKKGFSLNELLDNVMKKTKLGQEIIKDLNMTTLDLLIRNKIQLNG